MHTHTHIHTYMHTYAHTHTYIRMYIHTFCKINAEFMKVKPGGYKVTIGF